MPDAADHINRFTSRFERRARQSRFQANAVLLIIVLLLAGGTAMFFFAPTLSGFDVAQLSEQQRRIREEQVGRLEEQRSRLLRELNQRLSTRTGRHSGDTPIVSKIEPSSDPSGPLFFWSHTGNFLDEVTDSYIKYLRGGAQGNFVVRVDGLEYQFILHKQGDLENLFTMLNQYEAFQELQATDRNLIEIKGATLLPLETEMNRQNPTEFDQRVLGFLSVTINRFGSIGLILFLVSILVPLYRYNIRLSAFYEARADAIRLLGSEARASDFSIIAAILTPSHDFGPLPRTPVDQLSELIKTVRTR
jgi:hypothetical protein